MSNRPRILWVEDEERFRTTRGKMLAAPGLDVTLGGNGPKALEELKNQGDDVTLLNSRMPGRDGLEALSGILGVNRGLP